VTNYVQRRVSDTDTVTVRVLNNNNLLFPLTAPVWWQQ